MTYVISALSCDTYDEPADNAINLILYPRLFEELKIILYNDVFLYMPVFLQ